MVSQADIQKAEELLQKHQRDINCLIEDDRNIRKQGLTNIKNNLFAKSNDATQVLYIFQHNLCKNLQRCIEDPVEKHREMSFEILDKLYQKISETKSHQLDRDMIIGLIKIVASRVNQSPFPEKSEHIRLIIVEHLRKLLKHFPLEFQPLLLEITLACERSLLDQFPDMKRETSSFIVDLCQALPTNIGHHSTGIIKSLSQNLQHQHSKVRKVTINALVCILQTENSGKNFEICQKNYQLICDDKINDVRKCAISGVRDLLNGFSIQNLRLYENELVSLLLGSLSDEVDDIRALGIESLEICGLKRKLLAEEINEKIDIKQE